MAESLLEREAAPGNEAWGSAFTASVLRRPPMSLPHHTQSDRSIRGCGPAYARGQRKEPGDHGNPAVPSSATDPQAATVAYHGLRLLRQPTWRSAGNTEIIQTRCAERREVIVIQSNLPRRILPPSPGSECRRLCLSLHTWGFSKYAISTNRMNRHRREWRQLRASPHSLRRPIVRPPNSAWPFTREDAPMHPRGAWGESR